MLDELQPLVAHVPLLRDPSVVVTPLPGGLTNRNYRLDAEGESFVLRLAGANTELLGIDRAREVACCHAAANAGVGPVVIDELPAYGVLLTRFVPGRELAEGEARHPDVIRRLVRTLRRYHDFPVPPDLGPFSPFVTVRSYVASSRERNVPLPAELDDALTTLSAIEAELRTDEPPCLCHNDLLATNCIDDGSEIQLIDWEYGGVGDRFFDLGNLAVNLQLDDAGDVLLLEAYFGAARPDQRRRLQLMRLVSDLREATWGFLQSAVSTLNPADYYLDYGGRHLTRFLNG